MEIVSFEEALFRIKRGEKFTPRRKCDHNGYQPFDNLKYIVYAGKIDDIPLYVDDNGDPVDISSFRNNIIWTSYQPQPKFEIGAAVCNSSGDIAVVVNAGYMGDFWLYGVAFNANTPSVIYMAEIDLHSIL